MTWAEVRRLTTQVLGGICFLRKHERKENEGYYFYMGKPEIHCIFSSFTIKFFNAHLIFERERERESERWGGAERKKGREKSQAGSMLSAQSSISQTMRSWPELKPRIGHLTNWAIQVPHFSFKSLSKWLDSCRECAGYILPFSLKKIKDPVSSYLPMQWC